MQEATTDLAICLGPYGSGTNFLIKTLEQSGIVVSNGISKNHWNRHHKTVFKHYVVEEDVLKILTLPPQPRFVCIYKHPLFWFKSLQRMVESGLMPAPQMSQLKGVPLSHFIRQPGSIVSARREIDLPPEEIEGGVRVHYANLVDLWNQYARGYASRLPAGSILLPYEKVISKPDAYVQAILKQFSLDTQSVVIDKSRRFQVGNSPGHGRNFDESLAYYLEPANLLEGYSEEDLAFIEASIDNERLQRLGYASLRKVL